MSSRPAFRVLALDEDCEAFWSQSHPCLVVLSLQPSSGQRWTCHAPSDGQIVETGSKATRMPRTRYLHSMSIGMSKDSRNTQTFDVPAQSTPGTSPNDAKEVHTWPHHHGFTPGGALRCISAGKLQEAKSEKQTYEMHVPGNWSLPGLKRGPRRT